MKRNVLKTAVIGPSFAGKTALCQALSDRTIDREYISTIGVDYIITYKKGNINLALWDLAGLDRFESIIGSYIKESPLLIFCYSAESYESYYQMVYRYEIWKKRKYIENKRVIIVATKIDSNYANVNYQDWPKNFLEETGYTFVKTSANSKIGIQELFDECTKIPESKQVYNETIFEKDLYKRSKYLSCCLF